jgi:hypothetical protein
VLSRLWTLLEHELGVLGVGLPSFGHAAVELDQESIAEGSASHFQTLLESSLHYAPAIKGSERPLA